MDNILKERLDFSFIYVESLLLKSLERIGKFALLPPIDTKIEKIPIGPGEKRAFQETGSKCADAST